MIGQYLFREWLGNEQSLHDLIISQLMDQYMPPQALISEAVPAFRFNHPNFH